MEERAMPVPSRRLAVAGVIAAAVIALPAAAFASGSTSSGKPAPSSASNSAPAGGKSPAPGNSAPNPSAAAAMKAAARSGTEERQAEQAMVAALASQLGVSHSAAQRAMNQINALSDRNGVDPASPAFAAIAHELGVTPVRLAAALDGAKQAAGRSLGGH
jgi:hypothetical protein